MNLRCMALTLPLLSLTAHAQDARTVTAPVLPRIICTTLHATRTALAGQLDPKSESTTDTTLIQSAIDRCRPRAVELSLGTDGSNAFSTSTLSLQDGATLILDKGITLFASHTSADSLLNITGTHVSILGEGTLDGGLDAILIAAYHADGLTLSRITLRNALNSHINITDTAGFTAWNIHLLTTTPRTDGIRLSNSSNITIAHSFISTPDTDIFIDAAQHLSLLDNHLYAGDGILSRAAADILLDGLSEDQTTSGLRITGDSTLHLRNICMRGVPNAISISASSDPTLATPRLQLERITSVTPATISIAGPDAAHPAAVSLSSILITGIQPEQVQARFAQLTLGPGPVNFTPAGDSVTITKLSDHGHLTPTHACTARSFPPMQ